LVGRLDRIFQQYAAQGLVVWVQNPLVLAPSSEPQPDVVLLRGRDDDYLHALPTAADVLLIIEVSDTTLSYDREVKIPLYAAKGISECWLVDANTARLEMHRDPGPEGYRTLLRPDRDATVSPLAIPAAKVDLNALFAGMR
jgi:hypothetical protein